MAFNPKAVAAIKEKQRLGIIPKNAMNPQNIMKQIPILVPHNPLPSIANPMAVTTQPLRRFSSLRKKLGSK